MYNVLLKWVREYLRGEPTFDVLEHRWIGMVDVVLDSGDRLTIDLGNLVFSLLIACEQEMIDEDELKRTLVQQI